MTFDEWFVKYPLPAEIDTMDDTDREQWTWALRSAYKTGAAAEREACAKVCEAKAKRYDERAAQNAEVRDIDPTVASHAAQACEHAAAAIRARGQA